MNRIKVEQASERVREAKEANRIALCMQNRECFLYAQQFN